MVIKKWNATSNVWSPLSPKVTYTDIVADVTATNPVSIFSGGKLLESYLPNSVYGGMKFVGTISSATGLDLEKLIEGATGVSQSLDDVSGLDSTTGTPYSSADVYSKYIGHYWIISREGGTSLRSTQAGQYSSAGGYDDGEAPDEYNDDIHFELGDWVVITGYDTSDDAFVFSGINNTYQTAGNDIAGVIKLGYTDNNKNYAVELDANQKAYVNVPWTDNTFRTVTAGGNTLEQNETLAFTAGTNVSISENAGAVTIASTDTRRTIQLSGVEKLSNSSTTALNFAVGNNMSITENNGAFTFNSSHPNISASGDLTASSRTYVTSLDLDSNGHILSIGTGTETVTDTTYTAGNGIALSGTQFSVAGGIGLTQEASGLKMTYPIYHGDTLPDLSSVSGVDNVIGFEW